MITLYYRPTCMFSRQVLATTERLGLDVELKNIDEEALAAELVATGGKQQVPYLIDTEHDIAMYESDAIVAHLQKTYGTPTGSRPRVHMSDATCVSCEG